MQSGFAKTKAWQLDYEPEQPRVVEPLMGWTVGASEMPDFDYRLARHGGDAVAGFMSLAALPPGTPPNWLTYIAVKNADETARLAVEKGGMGGHAENFAYVRLDRQMDEGAIVVARIGGVEDGNLKGTAIA